ncbi:hypothetical protein [Streptomyces sp. f51]|uniref:hypothetical protein n=1 Tax=Streptomyces sp. f51 TaxID=1827742 RepID=UPI00117C7B3B|nr:hypothetical protein [Streptomyces sp. f51]
MGADDLVEDRLVERGRRIPEHVRAVRHGHVLGPHLVDQRVVGRGRDPGTVRRGHVEQVVVAGDRTAAARVVEAEHDPLVHGELAGCFVLGHLPGQFVEFRGPLIEP